MMAPEGSPRIALAANNGEIGGGEVMLLSIADLLERLGYRVTVIGPAEPAALVEVAAARGHATVALDGATRPRYMAALARWRLRNRSLPLWCNGLVPSLATSGLGPRIVHLHSVPDGAARWAVEVARTGARRVLVPSRIASAAVPRSTVLENWTEDLPFVPRRPTGDGAVRVGFLGRTTADKGVAVLARALTIVARTQEVRLVLAGESRFGHGAGEDAVRESLAEIESITERRGWMPRREFFAGIDLAVFPSIAPESFGLVVAESMAAGVPFVITDAGALPEVAGPHHPWIARRDDAEDLARVVARALDDIAEGDDARAAAARQRWERLFSPSAGAARVVELLSDPASPRTSRGKENAR